MNKKQKKRYRGLRNMLQWCNYEVEDVENLGMFE